MGKIDYNSPENRDLIKKYMKRLADSVRLNSNIAKHDDFFYPEFLIRDFFETINKLN